MQTLSIAQNKDTFFVSIDRHKVSEDKLNLIEKFLRSIVSGKKLKLDNSNIKPVSDEEQAEIEAILDAIPEDDKEIAFTKIVEFQI